MRIPEHIADLTGVEAARRRRAMRTAGLLLLSYLAGIWTVFLVWRFL